MLPRICFIAAAHYAQPQPPGNRCSSHPLLPLLEMRLVVHEVQWSGSWEGAEVAVKSLVECPIHGEQWQETSLKLRALREA